MSLRNGFSGQLRCWRGRSTLPAIDRSVFTYRSYGIFLTRAFEDVATRAWPINFCHDFSQLCRWARQGQRIAVLSARQFIGAATTALSLITGAFPLAFAAGHARAQGAVACDATGEIALL